MMKLIKYLINYDTKNIENKFDRHYAVLINTYILLLFSVFFFYSIFITYLFNDHLVSSVLTLLCFSSAACLFVKHKKEKKYLLLFVFCILLVVITFFFNYTGKNGGVEYFYFSVLFSIPFFFNIKKDLLQASIIIGFSVFLSLWIIIFEPVFLPKSPFLAIIDFKILHVINIIICIFFFILDLLFISKKDQIIYLLAKDKKKHISEINELTITNKELMKQQLVNSNLSEDNIKEIYKSAEENSPLFLNTFEGFFPSFIPAILNINPNLIDSELHLCALIRLNFGTKKIAQINNISVRAVESMKYRIRKKLNIPTEMNINRFILEI